MIPRYTPEPFAQLWSSATKFSTWLEVELAACQAMEHPSAALVPAGTAARLRGLGLRRANVELPPIRLSVDTRLRRVEGDG